MSNDQQLALKGRAVEEWLDVRFFRPVGILIARAALPTRITPNQISIAALVLGLFGAHLLFYEGWAINLTAFIAIVVADLLDSSDGQLARLRGTASRTGRMMDGFVDNVRWITVYVHLALRALVAGHGLWVLPVAVVAGYVHSLHSSVVDIVTFGYLDLAEGKRKVDLPEDLGEPPASWFWRHAWPFYRSFLKSQGRMFRRTVSAVRLSRERPPSRQARDRFARRAAPAVRVMPWFAQNVHIIALGAAGVAGMPLAFFAVGAIGMSAAALFSVVVLERAAAELTGEHDLPGEAPADGTAQS